MTSSFRSSSVLSGAAHVAPVCRPCPDSRSASAFPTFGELRASVPSLAKFRPTRWPEARCDPNSVIGPNVSHLGSPSSAIHLPSGREPCVVGRDGATDSRQQYVFECPILWPAAERDLAGRLPDGTDVLGGPRPCSDPCFDHHLHGVPCGALGHERRKQRPSSRRLVGSWPPGFPSWVVADGL